MLVPNKPANEAVRLKRLKETGLLGSASDVDYQRFTELALRLFDVPIALISLVDENRQWFKAKSGLGASETSRDISFCGHAILQDGVFEVPDALKNPSFADNPLVTGEPNIRAYAGVPLAIEQGINIGTLCVIDNKPRAWTDNEKSSLKDLAALVVQQIKMIDLSAQKQKLDAANKLSALISSVQSAFISTEHPAAAFDKLLTDILALTDSEYGFIGEVLDDNGQPYLKTHAITNIAWDEPSRQFFAKQAPFGLEFRNLRTLFGAALLEQQTVISNQPHLDPRAGGTPAGHPPLNSFLGLPIFHDNQMIALLGLANREPGYDQQMVDFLEPLQKTIGQLVAVLRLQRKQLLVQKELNLLSKVASQTTNAVIITDKEGRVEWVNTGFSKITGYLLEEIKGRKPGELLQGPETDQATVMLMGQALKAGNGFEVDILNYTKFGKPYSLRINCSPLSDETGQLVGFIAIESDISEQVRLEQTLKTQKEFFERIFHSNIVAITVLDEQGRLILANHGAQKILGISSQTSPEGTVTFSDQGWQMMDLNGEPLPESEQPLMQLKRGASAITEQQYKILWPDGEFRSLSVSGAPLPQTEAGEKQFVFFIQDITEHLQAEKMKNEFVSTVSHELRTPLTSINASIDLLQSAASYLPEKFRPLLKIAQSNGKRLVLLINDLLDMDKLLADEMQFVLEPHSVTELLQQALDNHQSYADKFNISLVLKSSDLSLQDIAVDEARFAQVMANLLSNAIKFSPEGSEVTVEMVMLGNRIRIGIRDQGPGIAEAFQPRIFQKFAQADSSDTRRVGGTGLGLAITKQLVEKMAGSIGFNSTEGHGAYFWIEFPACSGY